MAFLPMKCRRYLIERGLTFEEVTDGGQNALIFRNFELPPNQFDVPHSDVLIVLPPAYPDCAPDMFHTVPWLRLRISNQYPKAADQQVNFSGTSWQRWSRHNEAWRPGIDGIWTMVKRIETAFKVAA